MQARDATGRQVSLLNDEMNSHHSQRPSYRTANHVLSQSYRSSSPNTPELLRSASYDSNASGDPISPLTPSVGYDYSRVQLYPTSGHGYDDYEHSSKRPVFADSSRSTSFEDDMAASAGSDRPGKRYPCRYRDSHGCEKTFTTSGHASRHSKIHTAEKAVQCTFAACQKKFTRADNMKQHLETHYKDKSRSSLSHRSSSRMALSSSGRRSSSSSVRTSGGHGSGQSRESASWDVDQYNYPLPSPGGGAWDMRGLNLPLLSRPTAVRNPSSGLDALAMAIACQEGS